MKSVLPLLLLFILVFNTNAQDAPDFTVTDIDGNEHHLYDYLDDGKVVLIDFSTTWCNPCWEVHLSHVLEDLYGAFGPEGSDQLQILFLESDPSTGMDDLLGQTASTMGDWVTGVPFPIIDLENEVIPNAYGINGYPTLFWIRKSGDDYVFSEPIFIWELDLAVEEMFGFVNPVPGTNVFNVRANTPEFACAEIDGSLQVINYGSETVTDPTLIFSANGEVVYETVSNVTIASGSVTDVPFENLPVDMPTDFTVDLAVEDDNAENNRVDFSIGTGNFDPVIDFVIFADDYAVEETQLLILDGNGATVFEENNFPEYENFEFSVELPGPDCYQIIFNDSYGDGFIDGMITITDGAGTSIFDGTWEDDKLQFGINVSDEMSSTEAAVLDATAKVFPTPVTDVLHLQFNNTEARDLQLVITDILGRRAAAQTFAAQPAGNVQLSVAVADLPQGQYLLSVYADDKVQTFKFVK